MVSSAAVQYDAPASAANVIQVAIARGASATRVAERRPPGAAPARGDLTCFMLSTLLRSFRSRILALVLGLVTLVLTAAIVGIAVKARAEVDRQVGAELKTAAGTAREILRFRGSQLTTGVETLTSDFGFREAVSSEDAATLQSALENQRLRIDANLVIVLSPAGVPVASSGGVVSSATRHDLERLIADDADGETLQLYRLIDGRPYQLVLAPVLAPETIGWTAMGFALDDKVAVQMSRLLGVDVSFATGGAHPYVASSMDRVPPNLTVGLEAVPEATPYALRVGDEKLLTWTNPIRSANGPLTLVLQRSLSSALKPYEDIKDSMLVIGALLLAVATVLAVLLARSATRPVEELTQAAERLEAGDYGVAVPPATTTELKGLASAFNAMRSAVADREATIRHQANHHPLTGLPTRALISAILEDLLKRARAEGRALGVCLIEIQQFQSITGSFGHAAGDQVLCEVARRLATGKTPLNRVEHLRLDGVTQASDHVASTLEGGVPELERVAHLGTDQFLVLLDSAERARAMREAAAIMDLLRGSFEYSGVSFQLETRAGVAIFPDDGDGPADLLRRADLALFRAKESGATVGAYAKGDDEGQRQRLSILGELRRAIEGGQLELHYQPKVEARGGRVTGCEALLRWRHPLHGYVPPSEFIPHAERTGAIRSITAWVMRAALEDQSRWEKAGMPLDVSVNVSPVDFADGGFADEVAALITATGVNASRIILEVTESGAMKDMASTLSMMEQLRVLGVRFSIDDFGTGHSSLAHLKRLPVDEVKIDRSFVKELDERHDDAIVRSTIGLGHALNLKVVAEGVEDPAGWAVLSRLGCDLIQGYYVSKPLPAGEFSAWVRKRAEASPAAGAETVSAGTAISAEA
jgi:predicted signal transduction protein with EAL and GGDEF domain